MSEWSTETGSSSYDGAASFPVEVGETGPQGFADETDFSAASHTAVADSSGSDSDKWNRTITPDFNEPAGPNEKNGDKDDDKKGGGDQQPFTPPDKLKPDHTPPDTFINPKAPAP